MLAALDSWQSICEWLDGDDIEVLTRTCKRLLSLTKRYRIRQLLSFPMKFPHQLTTDQRTTVKNMRKSPSSYKLVEGGVGAGKTMVTIGYCLSKYQNDPTTQIVAILPPNLIPMWEQTLINYYDVIPTVFHSCNKGYVPAASWATKPTTQFILTSFKLAKKAVAAGWFTSKNDVAIVDEAHNVVGINFGLFREVIGLSATMNSKKSTASDNANRTDKSFARGVQYIANCGQVTEVSIKDVVFPLSNAVINKRLPPIEEHFYDLPIDKSVYVELKRQIDMDEMYFMQKVHKTAHFAEIMKEFAWKLTHPYQKGVHQVTCKFGRKTCYCILRKLLENEPNPILQYEEVHDRVLMCPKIVQALHIVSDAIANGDKVVIFDANVTALPIVAKFFNEFGIDTYIFSTHYTVSSREAQMAKFKASKEPCVLLSSVQMLAQGHNLPEANHVVILSQCPNPTTYKQAIGRCHRYPQSKTVHVHYLFSSGIDRYMYDLAMGSTKIEDLTFGEMRKLTEQYGVLD